MLQIISNELDISKVTSLQDARGLGCNVFAECITVGGHLTPRHWLVKILHA